ncbi:hypothetical protein [Maribacter sp. 1_MG-2023]|uniref:hypothetical protein n=1 Tax=Maribacter sp. 1_MG-2023 TaxID=3062677 RepID=UPI0026E1EB4C|nr:hypothetical protein [Maribacter sp. 1_MG-2023]MDO6473601.1 hypothetical protein [Maribacter sp. 1_MG-2023]
MRLTELCDNPKDIEELQIILASEYFEITRSNVNYLLELNEKDFSIEFDYVLAKTKNLYISKSMVENFDHVKDDNLTTYVFFTYMNYKIVKGLFIIDEYMEHCDEINKICNTRVEQKYDDYNFYSNYLSIKLPNDLVKIESKEVSKEEIKYLKFVAIDNSLTDPNILDDFHRVQFNPITIDEISFYFSNSRYEWLIGLMEKNILFDNSTKPISKIRLEKHLKEYGKGFRSGYFNYLEKVENENELFSKEKKIFINKIFSKVHDALNVSCLPLQLIGNTNNEYKKSYKIIEDELFEQGILDGEIYKAWMIVAEYNPMFRKKWKKENAIQFPNQEIQYSGKETLKNQLDYNWFKVGLLFANGEMDKLIKKHESNFTQIAKEKFSHNPNGYRPYISETFNNSTLSDKNIWKNKLRLTTIHQHCIQNGISMTNSFLEHFEAINKSGT